MSKALYLEAEFRTPENVHGGILMLAADEAYRLIGRAEQQKIRVLGIDAFDLKGGRTQPVPEHSVDYSVREFVSDSDWQTAVVFIKERASLGLHFEIVLCDAITTQKRA